MNRRNFLRAGIGTLVAGSAALQGCRTASNVSVRNSSPGVSAVWSENLVRQTRINLKPVMTNMVHTGVWEGPCRFNVMTPSEEMASVKKQFSDWAAGDLGI